MNEPVFKIEKHIATLSKDAKGWTKELNLVSWNNKAVKYDIRSWDPRHQLMSRGITLTDEEFRILVETFHKL